MPESPGKDGNGGPISSLCLSSQVESSSTSAGSSQPRCETTDWLGRMGDFPSGDLEGCDGKWSMYTWYANDLPSKSWWFHIICFINYIKLPNIPNLLSITSWKHWSTRGFDDFNFWDKPRIHGTWLMAASQCALKAPAMPSSQKSLWGTITVKFGTPYRTLKMSDCPSVLVGGSIDL